MSDFEFLRNITIGQYIPAESPLHRMDPRAKLLGVLFLTLAVTATRSILASLLLLGLLLLLTKVARLDITYVLRGLLPGLGILGFILLMQLIFQGQNAPCETMWFSWRFIQISPCLLLLMVLGLLRVLIFLFLISLLTLTTTASHLTNGAEALLSPFRRVGLPAHEIALASTIALRFIPTLAEELERIMKAQASRGNDLGAAPWYRLDKMVRERIPLIVPLFIGALRRAEDLIVAMEARGYVGGKGRTKFVRFASRWTDWAAVAATVTVWLVAWRIPWPF